MICSSGCDFNPSTISAMIYEFLRELPGGQLSQQDVYPRDPNAAPKCNMRECCRWLRRVEGSMMNSAESNRGTNRQETLSYSP